MGVFSGRSQYELVVNGWEDSTNAAGNNSVVGFQLIARVRSGYTNPNTWSSDPIGTYSLTLDGSTWSGAWTPDFRSTDSIILVADGKTVGHNTDGSKTVTFSFSANSNNAIGSASDSVNLTLTDFIITPTTPSAPTLARSTDGGTITVTSGVATTNTGLAITDYQYRYSLDGSSWSSEQAMGTGRVATFTGTPTQTFYFQTRAYAEAWGGWSSSSSIGGVPATPAAPTLARSGTGTSITVTSATASGASSYQYRYSTDGTNWSSASAMSGTTATFTGTATQTYYFQTLALNSIGQSSWSTTATVVGIPTAPSSVTATRTGRNVAVTAGASSGSGITGYFVQYSTDGTTWSTAQAMTSQAYTYTNLTASLTYTFRVYSTNSIGSSATTSSTPLFVPAGGKRWDGTAWTSTTTAKRWDGTNWVDLSTAKRWDGTNWVDLS